MVRRKDPASSLLPCDGLNPDRSFSVPSSICAPVTFNLHLASQVARIIPSLSSRAGRRVTSLGWFSYGPTNRTNKSEKLSSRGNIDTYIPYCEELREGRGGKSESGEMESRLSRSSCKREV